MRTEFLETLQHIRGVGRSRLVQPEWRELCPGRCPRAIGQRAIDCLAEMERFVCHGRFYISPMSASKWVRWKGLSSVIRFFASRHWSGVWPRSKKPLARKAPAIHGALP